MRLKLYCWIGIGLFSLLSAADLVLTRSLLQLNEAAYESNPAAAACLARFGWGGLALYKAAGVLGFIGPVALLAGRRPTVGAALVTLGCVVLLSVTTYSRDLIRETERENAELSRVARTTADPIPDRGQFAVWSVE